jgi:RimJ/RimL family protein N-acetyltransferase
MTIPTVCTQRLVLRPPRDSDAEAIAKNLNDFAVAGNLARVPYPYHLADAEAWLRTREPDTPADRANFAIVLDGTYIGQVGFHPGRVGPIIGYWLGQPYWGRGFMTEAVRASLGWFFSASRAAAVYSGVFHFNHASLAIQKKLGFVEIGRSTLLCLAREAEVEHIDTKVTREGFRQLTTASPQPARAQSGDWKA